MADFRNRSKSFLCALSLAADWMIQRNAGEDHWWRWSVLTKHNPDTTNRPIFPNEKAREIFDELIARGLLIQRNGGVDDSGEPAFTMKHDLHGWDKAVYDGRPLYARWLKLKRNWLSALLIFLFGCVFTILENKTVGLIEKGFDAVTNQQQDQNGEKPPAEGENK